MMKLLSVVFAAILLSGAAQALQADDERLALAHEVLELSNAAQMSREGLEITIPTMRTLFEAQYPNASQAQVDQAMALVNEAMLGIVPQIIEASAQIYAERFTADELRAISDFYRTPAGQKMVVEQSTILIEVAQISEQLGFQAITSVSAELNAIFAQ